MHFCHYGFGSISRRFFCVVLKRSISLFVNHFQENGYFIFYFSSTWLAQLLKSHTRRLVLLFWGFFFFSLLKLETRGLWNIAVLGRMSYSCWISTRPNTPVRSFCQISPNTGITQGSVEDDDECKL